MLLASDLRLEDAGAEISFGRDKTIRGTLRAVNHEGIFGMTTLTVDCGDIWRDYTVDADTLVHLDVDTELRIGGTPGRHGVWDRANQVANLQLLMGAITRHQAEDLR